MSQTTITGTARCVAELAAAQVELGWEVAVACPDGGPLPGWVRRSGATHRRWEAAQAPAPSTRAEAARLGALVEETKPDLVHLHSSKAGLAGRLAVRRRLPTIFQPHAWSFAALAGPARLGAVAWERGAARWADVVLCVSEDERRRGESVGVRADWRVVPNAVDLKRFREGDDRDRRAARERLGLDDAPMAVCVGRLTRQKAQDVLAAAWPRVRRSVPDARLVLVGDGPLSVRPGEGVDFAGEQDDVGDWYHAADVVVSPSRWEGMSLGVLEAMASGRSVVATHVEGMGEALGRRSPGVGAAGCLVPAGDVPALAAAVAHRLAHPDLAAEEGRRGRLRAERNHDLDARLDALRRLSLEVMGRR